MKSNLFSKRQKFILKHWCRWEILGFKLSRTEYNPPSWKDLSEINIHFLAQWIFFRKMIKWLVDRRIYKWTSNKIKIFCSKLLLWKQIFIEIVLPPIVIFDRNWGDTAVESLRLKVWTRGWGRLRKWFICLIENKYNW